MIVPVLGEGPGVNAVVDHLRGLRGGEGLEIIVVDGDPAGSTLACLDRSGVTGMCAPRGRASQMNAGAARASGEVLLFLHADTRLPGEAVAAVRRALSGGLARAGAFDLAFEPKRPALALLAWGARLRARLERIPHGDRGVFVTAGLFRDLGGFASLPIMEDVDFFLRLRRAGEPVVILSERARTSARRFERTGIWTQALRNLALRLGFALGLAPERLKAWYPDEPGGVPRDGHGRAGPDKARLEPGQERTQEKK